MGANIVEGNLDLMIFFWDPTTPQPHDVDVKALLRIAVLHNIPLSCNRATADYLISSPLFTEESYVPQKTSFEEHNNREILISQVEETESSN